MFTCTLITTSYKNEKKTTCIYVTSIYVIIFTGAENHNVQTKGIKSTKEGESLYLSGHVTGVEYHRISPNISYCYIKAIVARQKAQTQAPYSVWIILHKRTGKVENAYCNCPAGLRGHCKHCVSLLHFIVRQIEAGCNKACTSKPQEWHKPHAQGKRVTQPDFVRNLVVKKVTGRFDTTPEDLKKREINQDWHLTLEQFATEKKKHC